MGVDTLRQNARVRADIADAAERSCSFRANTCVAVRYHVCDHRFVRGNATGRIFCQRCGRLLILRVGMPRRAPRGCRANSTCIPPRRTGTSAARRWCTIYFSRGVRTDLFLLLLRSARLPGDLSSQVGDLRLPRFDSCACCSRLRAVSGLVEQMGTGTLSVCAVGADLAHCFNTPPLERDPT